MSTPDNPVLDAALAYAARGWPVLPVKDKRPLIAGGCHGATTDPDKIRQWWAKWPDAGVGIATGERSGLVVLDIDPRNGGEDTLHDLVRELGTLPHTAESQTGGGGWHRLFRWPGGPTVGTLGPGLDVKGAGGFVVAAPSLHQSGRRYTWELSSDPFDPDAPAPIADLPPAWVERVHRPQGIQEGPPVSPVSPVSPVVRVPGEIPDAVREMIGATLPTVPGERRARLGRLARGLKLNLGLADTDKGTLRAWVRVWHDEAFPFTSRQHGPDESWYDFLAWWSYVTVPLGGARLEEAFARAETRRPWPEYADFIFEERNRHLFAGCVERQSMTPGQEFVLTARDAGGLIGAHFKTAYDCLMGLALDERIPLIRTHAGKSGRGGRDGSAMRWRVMPEVMEAWNR